MKKEKQYVNKKNKRKNTYDKVVNMMGKNNTIKIFYIYTMNIRHSINFNV